jgi:hypothetical protein
MNQRNIRRFKITIAYITGALSVVYTALSFAVAVFARGFEMSWRLWSKVFAVFALILLWPVVDHCLLHWSPTVTGDSLVSEIVARWNWLNGLTLTLNPRLHDIERVLPLCLTFIAVHISACGFVVLWKAAFTNVHEDITATASGFLDRLSNPRRSRKSTTTGTGLQTAP